MTDDMAVLSIHIPERERLVGIFGPDAVEQALIDFGRAVEDLFIRLLVQHQVVDRHCRDAEGRWSVCFRMGTTGLLRDPKEICTSVETAGRRLVHDLLTRVFGAGTGMRVFAHVSVSSLSPAEAGHVLDGSSAWFEREPVDPPQTFWDPAISAEDVEAILARRSVRTLLQPIVRLRDRAVVGYEALSRGPSGSPLERPDVLFDAAHAFGRTVELELLCAELALERTRGRLPNGTFLTINLGPRALTHAVSELPLSPGGRRCFSNSPSICL